MADTSSIRQRYGFRPGFRRMERTPTVIHQIANTTAAVAIDEMEDVEMIEPASEPVVDSMEFVEPMQSASASTIDKSRHKPRTDDSYSRKHRLIIAIDFGTTYSTVAYARINHDDNRTELSLDDIKCITKYPSASATTLSKEDALRADVPTKLLFLGPGRLDNSDSSDNDADSGHDSGADIELTEVEKLVAKRGKGQRGRKRGRGRPAGCSREPNLKQPWLRSKGVKVKWGFGAQESQIIPEGLSNYRDKELVELIKLTLADEGDDNEAIRLRKIEINRQVDILCSRGIVVDRDHLLRSFLFRMLRHTKHELEKEGHLEGAQLEFVLCVPVNWSPKACRIMHDALTHAIYASELEAPGQKNILDIFIVSEPEVAAQFVVTLLGMESRMNKDESLVILDAGGGTVDISTYKVTSDRNGPIRLDRELIAPDGALCGSSLITELYLQKVKEKLEEIKPDIDREVLKAEAMKRAARWDILYKGQIDVVRTDAKPARQIGQSEAYDGRRLKWTGEEMREIFEPSLQGTVDLLERQLEAAWAQGLTISKLFLVGGFSDSPSLQARVQQTLNSLASRNGQVIESLWVHDIASSALARGAVLRSFRKQDGPSRKLNSSFGFLRHEPYGDFDEHKEAGAVPERDMNDQSDYVNSTIYWLVNAGEVVKASHQSVAIESLHIFDEKEKILRCEEQLWTSPKEHKSHFKYNHPKNEGASQLGTIVVDVSDRRDKFPLFDKNPNDEASKQGKGKYRLVRFHLVIEIEGKQLKYEARLPENPEDLGELSSRPPKPQKYVVRKAGYISLAPSFAPGVE